MPHYEQRATRDGMPVSIQCLLMKQNAKRKNSDMHYHDYTELLFGVEGTAEVYVGDKRYMLSEGDMVIVHEHEMHDVDGIGEPSSYIVVKFLPSILFTPDQNYSEYSYTLCLMQNTDTRQNFFHKEELLSTPIPHLFAHVMAEWNAKRFGYELSLRADVTSIFLHILRKWHDKNMSENTVNAWQGELIQRAIVYINKNYAELSEKSCADALGVSTSYLSRVFKSAMKKTFVSYVNGVKIREAERMLIATDMSITAIGECVGFSTTAYFIAIFKAANGTTPVQYRRSLVKHQ